ncbi:MAG: hypothetical protein ACR2NH_10110 [Solirubrobacteraceae bacterium]
MKQPTRLGVRLLVLDHFCDQDIGALSGARGPGDQLRSFSYEPLRREALRVFPPEVASGLEAYAKPEYEPHRLRWAGLLERYLEDEFRAFAFDVLVLPSDLFFYVREAAAASHRLGAPVVVVQKETTISPGAMTAHAERVKLYAPPVADRMTVCSERQREFWLRAGAEAERIEVTGQPRFDVYPRMERAAAAAERPTALFFSYLVDAYHPGAGGGEPVWTRLHRQTEEGLWELARAGWRVRIKPHPQQDFQAEKRRLRSAARGLRVELVDPGADARALIAAADVVVGFQTTALLEAMAAGKPVLYTGWDPEAARLRDNLVPLADWDDAIDVVTDAAALAPTARGALGRPLDERTRARRAELVEGILGPIDGHASERALAAVRRVVDGWTAGDEERARRGRLTGLRPPLRLRRRAGQRLRNLRHSAGAKLGR